MSEKVKHPVLWATLFTIISLAWVFPIVLVVINSFKQKAYISPQRVLHPDRQGVRRPAELHTRHQAHQSNRVLRLDRCGHGRRSAAHPAVHFHVRMVIVRVNNRTAKSLYLLFLFNMIVPFQMVMFTLSKIADMLGLNTPWACGSCIWASVPVWPCSSSPA